MDLYERAREIAERATGMPSYLIDDETFESALLKAKAEADSKVIQPMTGFALAIRKAHGGPLSSDGPDEWEAYEKGLYNESQAH